MAYDTMKSSEPYEVEAPKEPQRMKNAVQEMIEMQRESVEVLSAIENFLFADRFEALQECKIECLEGAVISARRNMGDIKGLILNLAQRLGV